MAYLLDLDDDTIALIASFLPLFDRVSLRGTCRRTRPLIPVPHKRTPQKQWRWAIRRDDPQIAQEAIEAGTRDLLRRAAPAATLSECRDVWISRFAITGRIVCKSYINYNEEGLAHQLEMTRAIFAGNSEMIMSRARSPCAEVYIRACKYLSETNACEIVRRLGEMRDPTMEIITICDIMRETLTQGRIGIAQHCATILEDMRKEEEIQYYYQENPFDYVILSGNVQAARHDLTILRGVDKRSMISAARSGNREMCEYVREFLGLPFAFGRMVMGAVASDHLSIIDLALEWVDKCATDEEIDFSIDESSVTKTKSYAFRADGIHFVLRCALLAVARSAGSSALFSALAERCKARALIARTLDIKRAAQLLAQPAKVSMQCIARMKHSEEFPRGPSALPSYDDLFEAAAKAGAYWLTDMIYELAEKDNMAHNIDLTRIDSHTLELIALPLRGRFARKLQ
jgi:hypothetical protein